MAVRLAELRLWLAVIADDPATAPETVAPLPNLDGIVRQGDALLDPARLLGQLGVRPRSGTSLGALRRAFVGATGADKPRLLRVLRRAELAVLEECLAGAARQVEREIVDCLDAARAPTLFGERRGLDAELRARLRRLRHQLGQVRRLHRNLRREGMVPWFQPECHFGDVLARGGFDVVAGNPPWVRAEQLPRRLRRALAERYRWWRGGGRGYAHQPDLALAFVERGFELTAAGGALALLVPAKLCTAGYARRLRAAG
jgi:hypothetical protein